MIPMAWSGPKGTSKKLWRIARSIYRMLRRGVIRAVDLHLLLLQRGKIAGKALGDVLASHHQYCTTSGGTSYPSAFSCRSMDLNTAFYSPREVQFSCSNTPSYPSFYSTKRRSRRHRDCYYNYSVASMAKAFEILNSEILEADVAVASPSPVSEWSYGKSPVAVRQLRVTDSPFPTREEEEEEEVVDGRIDSEAEEFIRWFYEQLRLQPCVSPRVVTGASQYR
ncbi:uncharacterized protein LOC103717862 [Phoenix dactylifera]|uniref:Uncharacterized protein LOC103717862 n=1 Tax=Phoenix dactylifera TaxID=42345 RepID=A0A8B7CRV9_PHODC|nr:uncharacterized protein LOC103717862 [Phoenix dactylifera]